VRKPRSTLPFVALLGIIAFGVILHLLCRDSPPQINYKKIQIGMTIEEVQAILGEGTLVRQTEVPSRVVPLNPKDEEAAIERARRAGGPVPTARDYPTRTKPIVEGDYILRWVNGSTGERILIAFKHGSVCEKDFYDPNYL
jgi:hypothetical protein